MTLLFHIVRAGHASGTHHKLALDALAQVAGPYAERWQRLLLSHAGLYLEGAKAPDTQFKDFKNHVLHVREKLWGGAPAKAANWYQHLLAAIRDRNWGETAWCAGVLSHYYTDPIHPFHTGQSAAENNVHRAVEWSISRSYDGLYRMGEARLPAIPIEIGQGDGWLEALVEQGARRSNVSYEALLAHYDIHRGVVDPPAGLDPTAQALIADLLRYAALSFARVLERAFAESAVVPPEVPLAAATALAMVKLPVKAVLKRIDDRQLRTQVEAMFDELQATGRVEKALPEDERVVRALHAKEVLGRPIAPETPDAPADAKPRTAREHRPAVARLQPTGAATATEGDAAQPGKRPAIKLPPTPPAPSVSPIMVRPRVAVLATVTPEPTAPVASKLTAPVAPVTEADIVAAGAPTAQLPVAPGEQPKAPPQPAQAEVSAPLAAAAAMAAASAVPGLGGTGFAGTRATHPRIERAAKAAATAKPARDDGDDTRIHLTPEQDVVDAPSIGPKTADRMKLVGVKTVADLFAADPGALAEELNVAHIRAKTIAEWQDQARLVCEVPGLRGTHAQLLVGAGYRDLRRIARADPSQLSVDVLRFIQTSDGQRILRSGGAPDLDKIVSWVMSAERVWAAKAA